MDEAVIQAATGTAYIGEEGDEAVDLPSTQKVPVNYIYGGTGGNSGLTLAKLIKARSILGSNEADGNADNLMFFYTQRQLDDLLINVDQVSNGRYADVKALIEGKVTNFMGFEFVKLQLLDKDPSTNVRTCIAMVSSGVAFAMNGMSTKITVRDDLNETLQIRTKARYGAVRTEEEKVVAVYCDEQP